MTTYPEYIVMKKEYCDKRGNFVSQLDNDHLKNMLTAIFDMDTTSQISLYKILNKELNDLVESGSEFSDLLDMVQKYKPLLDTNSKIDVDQSLRKIVDGSNISQEYKIKLLMCIT